MVNTPGPQFPRGQIGTVTPLLPICEVGWQGSSSALARPGSRGPRLRSGTFAAVSGCVSRCHRGDVRKTKRSSARMSAEPCRCVKGAGHSWRVCQALRKRPRGWYFPGRTPAGGGGSQPREALVLIFTTVFPNLGSIQRKQTYLPECSRKNNSPGRSVPPGQAYEMPHSCDHSELHLIRPCGLPARPGTPVPFLPAPVRGPPDTRVWSSGHTR